MGKRIGTKGCGQIRSDQYQNGDKQQGIFIKRNVSMYSERSYITEVFHGQRMFNTLTISSEQSDIEYCCLYS